ncbi:MAG: AAA family ATPase [Candidatus Bilamarchaeum sp.]|jgi:hypothetical protein
MKGNNPFIPWGENPLEIISRKEELTYFRSFVQAIEEGVGAILSIYGGIGVGKTIMLKRFELEANQRGVRSIYIKCQKNDTIKEIERNIVRQYGKNIPFDQLIGETKLIILLDDFEKIHKYEENAKEFAQTIVNSKIGIILSTVKKIELPNAKELEIKPFEEHEAREFVSKSMQKEQVKMGDEFIGLVFSDCGGNPKAMKLVCWHAFETIKETDKVITKGHYLVYLPALMNLLSKEWFGQIYSKIPNAEVKILNELAKSDKGAHVSDIASRLGRPIGQITVLIGRLLERGQIIKIERGKYSIFCKLYSKYIIDQNQ